MPVFSYSLVASLYTHHILSTILGEHPLSPFT